MNKKHYVAYSFVMVCMLALTLTNPSFGQAPEPKEPEPEPVKLASFVDPAKDPQHYLNRYYDEPTYKAWFDKNYPDITIEEAVGAKITKTESSVKTIIENDILPKAEAVSEIQPANSDGNSEIAVMILAIGGLGILFGAVFGIKKQVDTNSKQISINKDIIRKKIINPLMGLKPVEVLQTRLAKGDLTLEEFEELEKKLK